MKDLKKLIFAILFIIFIIIIVMTLIIFLEKQKNNDGNNVFNIEEGEEIKQEEDANGFIDANDFNICYSVINSLNKCVENIKYNENVNIDDENDDGEPNLEVIYDLLDKNYINNNKIDLNNIKSYIYEMDENTTLIPIQMKVRYEEKINIYILKTYLVGNSLQEKYFIIRVDTVNQTFSIEFINEKVSDIEKIKIEESDKSIEKNDYNSFSIEMISDGIMMQKYVEHYRNLAINCPEVAYKDYLDEEYKEKRFGTLENYKKYINDNIDEIETVRATKYLVEENDNNKINYVCLDQYQNTYVFDISTAFQYKIKLDTYTLTSDKFITTYNNSDSKNKVMMNVDKFVMMLNNRDYNSAYELLDENFRNNNFGSKEEFEQYMRNNCPLHYDVKYETFEQKGNNIFTQNVILSSINDNNTDSLKLNIVMKLEEGTDYLISFNIE